MKGQTGELSFIYKHFDNADTHACNDWSTIKNANISKADAKAYLLDGCPGLRDLVDGIKAMKQEFPAHANVTFWGDEGDGVTNIPRNVLAALHEIFVVDRDASSFKHVAFDRLFTGKSTSAGCTDEDHCKHLIQIDGSRNASVNGNAANNGTATNVFETWSRWQSNDAGY